MKSEKKNKFFIFSIIDDNSNIENKKFVDEFKKRKNYIKNNYKIIIFDPNQPNDNNDNKMIIYTTWLKEVIELSNYLESINNKKIENNDNSDIEEIKNELIYLYNKIIEFANLINEKNISEKYSNKLKIYIDSKKKQFINPNRFARKLRFKVLYKNYDDNERMGTISYLPSNSGIKDNIIEKINVGTEHKNNTIKYKKIQYSSIKIAFKKRNAIGKNWLLKKYSF